eukprot:2494643-Pyramimonas_sp.AAC.1
MGNEAQAAVLQGRLDRRRQQEQPAPLQVQAKSCDRQIKTLENIFVEKWNNIKNGSIGLWKRKAVS